MCTCMPPAAQAQELPRVRLLGLAKQFVDRINKGFESADDYLASLYPNDVRLKDSFLNFPDGEILILQISIDRNELPQPIIAIKQGRDVMISLADFVAAAGFAIDVKPQDGLAQGWFIREEQTFLLDTAAQQVSIGDETMDLFAGDFEADEADILVRGRTLSRWFGFKMAVNGAQQIMNVVPEKKWPFQEKLERLERMKKTKKLIGPPKLPLKEDPYDMVSVPNADINIRQTYTRKGEELGGETTKHTKYTMQTNGDLAGHTANATFTGNEEDKLSTARISLGKASEHPDLLGPLKARSYRAGDIGVTSVPFAGGGGSELGARISNSDPYTTRSAYTEINGEALPGWDVELFRDNQLLGLTTAGPEGFYRFENIPLFGGRNNLRIVLYGPQGEIREENRTLVVNNSLRQEDGVYDVSLSMSNAQVYSKTPSDDPDKDTPHLAATYERQITDDLILRSGINARQEEGVDKIYLQGGATGTWREAILDADAVVENEGAYLLSATARKRFGRQNTFFNAQYTSKDYTPGSDREEPAKLALQSSIEGPLPYGPGERPRYSFDSSYLRDSNGNTVSTTSGNFSTNIKKLAFGTGLDYNVSDVDSITTENLSGMSFVRGSLLGVIWRGTAEYNLKPEQKFTQYQLMLQRRLSKELDGKFTVKHKVLSNYTQEELALEWHNKHISISPSISYDTDNTVAALVATRFGLSYDPYSGNVAMSGRGLSNNGGVSAHVFLDHDGDNVFSEGDENLELVTVEALQARRTASTDESGNAFLFNLPINMATDVKVQESSFFDPFWVPGFAGISVHPRPGHVTQVDFPIHMAGEIDGTIYAKTSAGSTRALRNINIQLYNADAKLEQTTASGLDGYYLLTKIPPGRYFIMVDGKDAKNYRLIRPVPEEINIGFDGTVIAGHNIFLETGDNDVPATILANLDDFAARHPDVDLSSLSGKSLILNLGDYNSRLLMALTWHRINNRYHAFVGDTMLLVPPSQSMADTETGKLVLRAALPDTGIEDAYNRCRSLNARGIYCMVEILPGALQQHAATDAPPKT